MSKYIAKWFGEGASDQVKLRRGRRRQERAVRPALDCLEGRQLLSAFARGLYGSAGNDMTVFRESNGTWYSALNASNFNTDPNAQPTYNRPVSFQWGTTGDIPIENSNFFGHTYSSYGAADLAVFRPSNGTWYIKDPVSGRTLSTQYGQQGDIPLPASDFFGNGHADLALFRPSDGTWYIKDPLTNQELRVQWGTTGDVPIAHANFDNDGKADIAVYRPSDQTWHVLTSSTGYARANAYNVQWGTTGDVPILNSDFNGYGWDDFAVFRPSNGTWYVYDPRIGRTQSFQYGTNGDVPIASSDFFGNHHSDLAVFRPSNGTWYIKDPVTGTEVRKQWGVTGDEPLPNMDFDGDGKADIAVFRTTDSTWHVLTSSSGFNTRIDRQWGAAGDVPTGGPIVAEPVLNNGTGLTLKSYLGNPLFAADGPVRDDVHQTGAGDCYFLAAVAGTAERDPSLIRRSIADMGNGTFAVTFGLMGGTPKVYLVDANLEINGSGNLVNAQLGHNNCIWAALMEKAWTMARPVLNVVLPNGGGTYAPSQYLGTYRMLDGNGTQNAGLGAPGGYASEFIRAEGGTINFYSNTGNSFYTQIDADLGAGKLVLVNTNRTLTSGSGLVAYHIYVVEGFTKTWINGVAVPILVNLYNPWGYSVTVSFTDFMANVGGETSGSV